MAPYWSAVLFAAGVRVAASDEPEITCSEHHNEVKSVFSDLSHKAIVEDIASALSLHEQMAEQLLGDWQECDLNSDWALDAAEEAECSLAETLIPRGLRHYDADGDGVATFVECISGFETHGHPEFGRGPRREWEYDLVKEDTPWGGYECEVVHHKDVTREWLLAQDKPVVIKGVTDEWTAMEKWDLPTIVLDHGDEPYTMEPEAGNTSFAELTERKGRYNMGHVLRDGDCYMERGRPYSPFLHDAIGKDFAIPSYLQPMKTFQMGMGNGQGIGVVPEAHPSAFFVVVRGRKRWLLSPPSINPPRAAMRHSKGCHPRRLPVGSFRVDHEPGDVVWVPDYWWHETCGLDAWNIGVGGVTYPGCEHERLPECNEKSMYLLRTLPDCVSWGCPTLDKEGRFK